MPADPAGAQSACNDPAQTFSRAGAEIAVAEKRAGIEPQLCAAVADVLPEALRSGEQPAAHRKREQGK